MGSGWGQSFSYDGFGNLTNVSTTAGSTPNLSVTYDYSTNRRTSDCADGSGNISPCGTPYTFDAANRITLAAGYHYSYDTGNRRVWRDNGTTDELTYYSASGAKLCVYNLSTSGSDLHAASTGNFEYFAGKMLKNSGVWINQDRLGSTGKYFPFGQDRGSGNPANGTEKFGTYKRDSETGLDYAVNRYEAPGDGRFLSPDPYQASGGPADPGSWNRYAYTRGDPVNNVDPNGLEDFDAGWFVAHMAELSAMVPDGQCMILAMAASQGNDSAAAQFGSGCVTGQQAPMMDAQGAYCAGLAAALTSSGGPGPQCGDAPVTPAYYAPQQLYVHLEYECQASSGKGGTFAERHRDYVVGRVGGGQLKNAEFREVLTMTGSTTGCPDGTTQSGNQCIGKWRTGTFEDVLVKRLPYTTQTYDQQFEVKGMDLYRSLWALRPNPVSP